MQPPAQVAPNLVHARAFRAHFSEMMDVLVDVPYILVHTRRVSGGETWLVFAVASSSRATHSLDTSLLQRQKSRQGVGEVWQVCHAEGCGGPETASLFDQTPAACRQLTCRNCWASSGCGVSRGEPPPWTRVEGASARLLRRRRLARRPAYSGRGRPTGGVVRCVILVCTRRVVCAE